MHFEATLYEQARQVFLSDIANMNLRNDQFADKKGGVEALDQQSATVYNMNRDRLIRLVQYHDATQQYIEQLHQWIDELVYAKRALSEKEYGWQAMFPKLRNETEKEWKRNMIKTNLQLSNPELF